ncbi:MAG: DNA polymerase III subunit delta [Bacteroidota bacterium]
MAHTAESIVTDLKSGKVAPVYFLQGEETYYIDQISNYIENNVLNESEKGFNQTILYGRDAPMNVVLTHAKRFPMMAERQVVIVKEAQNISDLNREVGQKILCDYLQNPVTSTVLVFCHKNKTLDKRKALGKLIDKKAVVLTTRKLYDNQVPAWVEGYIRAKGFSASPKAVQMLSDSIGTNLERLANEIDKIFINYKEPVQIDEQIVQKYVGISKDYNIFELQKALTVKDVFKANQIVNYFEANPKKNPLLPIIAVLFSFYSKLLMAHQAKDKSERNLASQLRVSPFFVKDYLTALRYYPLSKVVDNIHCIQQADLHSKGIGNLSSSDGSVLKELIFRLMH